jgi:alpha-galactosidase/6-phospho-beta-glucosidase family protein
MVRISVIGGGSLFVVSLLHGLWRVSDDLNEKNENVEISLYDIIPERAEIVAKYGWLLNEKAKVPVIMEVASTRDECLKDSDIVLLSITLSNSIQFARTISVVSGLSSEIESGEFGPSEIAIAARSFPFMKKLGKDIKRLSQKAILLNLVNPTDLIAELIEESTGVQSFGLCVEVEHLRDHLCYYFNYRPEQISMIYAGVNHDGWVLSLTVDGEDGYKLLHDKILSLPKRADFHPGNQTVVILYQLTGYLRSSMYHSGIWNAVPCLDLRLRDVFYGTNKYEREISAVKSALEMKKPIQDNYLRIHPELSPVRYLGTGIAIARLARSIAMGRKDIFALQPRNQGSITNFPRNVRVEVPVIYNGGIFQPLDIGEFPEWLGWTSKQLAIKRKLAAEYILTHDKNLLRHALISVPQTFTVNNLAAYIEILHGKLENAKESDWELTP